MRRATLYPRPCIKCQVPKAADGFRRHGRDRYRMTVCKACDAGRKTDIKASGELPRGWWTDPILSDWVYSKIRDGIDRGMTGNEIARHVGCTSRTITRYKASKMRA